MRNAVRTAAHSVTLVRYSNGRCQAHDDHVAVEEPLEIRLESDAEARVVTVTMRTPGEDVELAAGFLLGERVIADVAAIERIEACGPSGNVVRVRLKAGEMARTAHLERSVVASSACGLCGKTSIDSVMASLPDDALPLSLDALTLDERTLRDLPRGLRDAQPVFQSTGGLHAVASFTVSGKRIAIHEDIGRHNAFDKLVGEHALRGTTPLSTCVVMLSGRAGFEMLQKAAAARVPLVAAIGAPSSLAVELAQRAGITLVGFLRESAFNVYSHPHRVRMQTELAMERS